jgi:tetratricopeptide (TPR) repeat protein
LATALHRWTRWQTQSAERADLARTAVAEDPDNWLAWLWYDSVLTKARGSLEERRAALSRASRLAPEHQRVFAHLAALEADAGHLELALVHAQKMFQRPPCEDSGIAVYTSVLSRLGRCREAEGVERVLRQRLENRTSPSIERVLAANRAICSGR